MKYDNSGKIHYGLLILTTLIAVLLMEMSLELRFITNKRDSLSDGILLSDLSACTADAERFVNSMEIIKGTDGSYDFRKMAENAVIEIDEQAALDEFMRLMELNRSLYGVYGSLTGFIVYNINGNITEVSTFSDGRWTQRTVCETLYTPNGVPVVNTGVYACVNTVIDGLIIKNREVLLENCVMLRINEDLQ